jgi:hypothetical protein
VGLCGFKAIGYDKGPDAEICRHDRVYSRQKFLEQVISYIIFSQKCFIELATYLLHLVFINNDNNNHYNHNNKH